MWYQHNPWRQAHYDPYHSWQGRRNRLRKRRFSTYNRNLDPTLLIAFNRYRNPYSRHHWYRGNRRGFDVSRLSSLRRNKLDPSRLVAFRRNRGHAALDPARLIAFRRNRLTRTALDPTRLAALRGRYRCNPDPEGKPWGPKLYNPLVDNGHRFKNEAHYQRMISKLRRNPW